MSYSTKEEVREMLKDDALNAIIGDTFIEDPAEREELVAPIIEGAIADADAEIDGYLANAAIKFFELVADGKVSIGTEADDPASAAATGFSAKSNTRLFTRGSMRGM